MEKIKTGIIGCGKVAHLHASFNNINSYPKAHNPGTWYTSGTVWHNNNFKFYDWSFNSTGRFSAFYAIGGHGGSIRKNHTRCNKVYNSINYCFAHSYIFSRSSVIFTKIGRFSVN